MGKAYDINGFLEMLDGNREELKMMIEMFIDLTPPLLAEMQEAANKKNWKQAGDLAHKLKSSLRLIKADSLVEEALYIEKHGREGIFVDMIPLKISQMNLQLLQIIEDLKEEI